MGFRQASRRVCRLLFHRGTIDLVFPFSHATQYLHADRRRFYRSWGRHNLHRKFIVARGNSSGRGSFWGGTVASLQVKPAKIVVFNPILRIVEVWLNLASEDSDNEATNFSR